MQIICTTTTAAAEVLACLLAAHLQPSRHFEIRPTFTIIPPITYTMLSILTKAQMRQIGAVANTTIIG